MLEEARQTITDLADPQKRGKLLIWIAETHARVVADKIHYTNTPGEENC